jgi:hypothetical protein
MDPIDEKKSFMIVAMERGSITGTFSLIIQEGVILVGLREVTSLIVFQSCLSLLSLIRL